MRDLKKECRRARELFSEMIDDPGNSFVQDHLQDCFECRDELRKLTRAIKLLQALPEITAPPFFTSKLMHRIQDKSDRASIVLPFPRFAYAAAAFSLLFLLVKPMDSPDKSFHYLLSGIGVRKASEYVLPHPERIWNAKSNERNSEIEWLVGNARILENAGYGRLDLSSDEVRVLQTSYGF